MIKDCVHAVFCLSFAFAITFGVGCTEAELEDSFDENQQGQGEPADTDQIDEPWVSPQAFTGEKPHAHGGLDRTYYLHIPQNLPENAALVVVMHGYTGSASGIMGYSGMNSVADENGFVVLYPQGTADSSGNNFFNVGYEFHAGVSVDDVAYIKAVIAHLQETYSLSEENVFATGMSNGGDMSYLLACEASDVFKAVAPVAGMMLQSFYDTCDPARLMPVFEIHGTQDDVTYWDGDMENEDGWGAYPDMRTIIDFWIEKHALEEQEITELPNINTNDRSTVVFERYWSSNHNNEVWLYQVVGGGHDWPGAWGNMDIDSSTDTWMFFTKYLTP